MSGDARPQTGFQLTQKIGFKSFLRLIIQPRKVHQIKQEEFTEKAWKALISSREVAEENQQITETEHLMKALLDQQYSNNVCSIFVEADFHRSTQLHQTIVEYIKSQPKTRDGVSGPMYGRYLQGLIQRARKYKKNFGDSLVSEIHLVLGLAQDTRIGKQLFTDFQISQKALLDAVHIVRGALAEIEQDIERWCKGHDAHGKHSPKLKVDKYGKCLRFAKAGKLKKYKALDKYGECLTSMAKAGNLDPVIGMDDEIRKCISILSCRNKRSLVIIDEAGEGVTGIAEGLALRIMQGNVPQDLRNCELISLNMGALIANTQRPGEFEARIEGVLKEVSDSDGQIILYIDDVHILIDPGATIEQQMGDHGKFRCKVALRNMLGHTTLRCIVATTLDDYHKYIEHDSSLVRHFKKVYVRQNSATSKSQMRL